MRGLWSHWIVRTLVIIVIIILVAIVVAVLGGFELNLHAGHFFWNFGVNK